MGSKNEKKLKNCYTHCTCTYKHIIIPFSVVVKITVVCGPVFTLLDAVRLALYSVQDAKSVTFIFSIDVVTVIEVPSILTV